MNNLIIRSLTGLVFIVLVLGSIIVSKFIFGLLFLIFTILGLLEFYKLIENDIVKPQKAMGVISGTLIYFLIFSCNFGFDNLFNIYISIPLLIPIFIYEIYRKKDNPFINIGSTITGIIYIVIPLALLNIFYARTAEDRKLPEILLMLFFTIWIYDTGAYLTGMLVGKHKLFERISPKKTWEGLIGGFILSLVMVYYMSHYFKFYNFTEWFVFAVIVIIGSTFGDLSESLLKRSVNIKDSGNIFPGHGGILDRFDSVLIASPLSFIFIYVIDYFK